MSHKRKHMLMAAPTPWPPPVEKSPNPVPEGFGAARKVGASTPGRSRANTESPWRAPFARGLQQPQMIHPTRNAHGGARGLSPTETPERMEGNK